MSAGASALDSTARQRSQRIIVSGWSVMSCLLQASVGSERRSTGPRCGRRRPLTTIRRGTALPSSTVPCSEV
jgi:hypothetical protein